MTQKLILLRGTPGSGKSTLAKMLISGTDTKHIEADQYFMIDDKYNFDITHIGLAHKWCQDMTDTYLTQGYNVVCSNTFTTKKELKSYFEIGEKHEIVPNVIVCQNEFENIHSVPEETLKKMKERFTYDISSLFEIEETV